MKSRIPHSIILERRSDSHSQRQAHPAVETANTPSSDHEANTVRDALISLGAPDIPSNEFARLYCGRLANALLFVSRHVKGREEVVKAREIIHRCVKSNDNLIKPLDIDYLGNVKNAKNRISSSQMTLCAHQSIKLHRVFLPLIEP